MNQRFVTNDRKIHDTFVVRFQKYLFVLTSCVNIIDQFQFNIARKQIMINQNF